MHTQNLNLFVRKVLHGVAILAVLLSAFGVGSLSTAQAQEDEQPNLMSTTETLYEWSPVADIVLYWSLNSENGGPGLRPYDLNLYNAQTDQHYMLASGGYSGVAKFSRDGSTISFWYDNAPYIVNLDSNIISASRIETDGVPVKGAFSSNNDTLIYTTDSDEIRVRNLITNLETSLGIFKNIPTLPYLFPEWSPDDHWVVFGGELNSILVDPSGINDSIILSDSTLPQSELSPITHYFIWSNGGSSLYNYNGELVYSFTLKVETEPMPEPKNLSFDGSFEISYLTGELFLRHVSSNTKKQITTNNDSVKHLIELSSQAQSNIDATTQAIADGFDYPVGKPNGVGYNPPSVPVAGCEWLQSTNGCGPLHPGIDINGNGGGDTDKGNPVYAVANGTVIYAQVGSGTSWGNIIMIEHTLPNGSKIWSQYAHLQDINVYSGTVNKGDQIGTIGKGYNNNKFYAHLHFEIRTQYLVADFWPPSSGWTVTDVEGSYVNPIDYINSHRTIEVGPNNCQNTGGSGIRLYEGANCTGTEKYFSSSGFVNMPDVGFNDMASSINVGDGWSVKVYENDNRGGSSRCMTGDMWDLAQDKYTSGDTNRVINNDISSIEVYSNGTCSDSTPVPDHSIEFYKSSNYGDGYCYGDDVGNYTNIDGCSGYNDQISSVLLKSGWSVRVYENADLGGGSKCYTSSDADLSNDTFDNGVSVNDKISSFTLYNQTSCSSPPNVPTLNNPVNGSSNPHNYDLNFQWNSSSGATEYLLEWWGGPYSTMQPCGWSNSTSCHIGTVAAGNTYSWHVKARNSAGESNWSDTWTFTIQSNLVPDLVVQSITASPSTPSLNRPVTFTVRIKNQGTGDATSSFYVDFYVDSQLGNCPSDGITYWTINSLAAGATQDLTYTYAGFSTSGTHNVYAFADSYCSITESNDGNNTLGPIALTVQQPQPPLAPTLSSPGNGSSNPYNYNLNFQWNSSSGATEYLVEWWGGPYSTMQPCVWISSTSCPIGAVAPGNTYSWHVKARNGAGESSWSDTWTFTILSSPPTTFNKSGPSNGAINQSINPTLSWGASSGATSYEYCYDTTNDNACSAWTTNGASISKALSGLGAGITYYWHVRAVNSGGTTYSNASATAFWSFTTATNPPGAFNKSAPSNGATGQSTSPTLTWGTSIGATSYEYCYDTTNDNACSTWTSNGASTSKGLSGLSASTTYYWHVRANGSGTTYANGSSTAYWSFTTAASTPVQATDAWTADENWDLKTSFNPGDPIQWVITVENTTANNATVDMIFDVKGPSGQTIKHAEFTLDTEPGVWFWAIADTVSNVVGTYTFTGSVVYQGVTTTRSTTYVVNAPLQTFADVPASYWANGFIERLYNAGVTGGCTASPLNYCPESIVTRAQMAVFLLRGMHGSSYTPPAVGASTGFTDVPVDHWAAAWIKQLAAEGITGGCGSGNYCPDVTVTRAQMAIFLLRAEHGPVYTPPAPTGVFTDVPVGHWADKWIEQLAVEGITGGCGVGVYCPETAVTRAQMAVFLVKTFKLP